jgi:hypothetical protein
MPPTALFQCPCTPDRLVPDMGRPTPWPMTPGQAQLRLVGAVSRYACPLRCSGHGFAFAVAVALVEVPAQVADARFE